MFPYLNDYFRERKIDNYKILMLIGIFAAIVCFFILAKKTKLKRATFYFYLFVAVLSIIAGLYSAMLFQAIYNFAETGVFAFKGMTVMGGILGAAIFFILVVFLLGLTKLGNKHKSSFWIVVNLIIPCIVLAQFFGRLGCFTAGCCYGKETESILGFIFIKGYMNNGTEIRHEHPRLPTQLFEAAFMLLLFMTMMIVMFAFKKKNTTVLMYSFSYSVFRFCIEFLRDDYRGASFLGLSPSQLQSIGLFVLAVILTIVIYIAKKIPFYGNNTTTNNHNLKKTQVDSNSKKQHP